MSRNLRENKSNSRRHVVIKGPLNNKGQTVAYTFDLKKKNAS